MSKKVRIKHILNFILFIKIMAIASVSMAQQSYTLSGKVTDKANGETFFGATVFLKGTSYATSTNEYGFYSLTAPAGNYTLTVSYVGYTEYTQEVNLSDNQKLDFELTEKSKQLEEVVVVSTTESEATSLKKPQMSISKLSIKTIKQMPALLGEVDIMKSLQLLPGVTNNGEGSGELIVRGGGADQNLVLLDEAVIYNTSHLLGFFSTFNADAIKDIKLYKGNIPANFGGRASSVLDVRQKDGNNKTFAMTGGIGLLSSRLALEGPMYHNKGSFLVAARSSYVHLFLNAAGASNSVNFYDLNIKTNYNINKNNRIYLSGYFGRDVFNSEANYNTKYGNLSGNLRWNHIFNERLFSNLSLIYSKYNFKIGLGKQADNNDWLSSIKNYNIKYDFQYYLNDVIKLDFGVSSIFYDFNPGESTPTSLTIAATPEVLTLDKKKAVESGVYMNAEHTITDKLTAQYGLRYSAFNRLGNQPITTYGNGLPVLYNDVLRIYERGTPTGETNYAKGETIKYYGNLEPRLGLAYQLNPSSSVKLGYSRLA